MAQQVQTEPYVDLKLLECSRKSSIEVGSGNNTNNALFMNKVEEGYMLNVGDKVSIHSAVVSEIGAGGNTIELKGNKIGRVHLKDLVKTEIFTEKESYLDSGYDFVLNRADAVRTSRFSYSPDLYDNKLAMSIQYYKATNGENCFSLPRRFANKTDSKAYTENDAAESGATIQQLRNGRFVELDYSRDRNASSRWNNIWVDNREITKIRQDGTKFTLFTRLGTTWFNANATKPSVPSFSEFKNGNGSLDPAVHPYVVFNQLKEIEIEAGRRSADFIAESFTDSLQNASSLEKYYMFGVNPSTPTIHQNQGVLAATYKTDTFKPFNCANSEFNKLNYDATIAWDGVSVLQTQLNWINSFENVCFKRPDFVMSGRWDWGNGFFSGGLYYTYVSKVSNDNISGRSTMRISITKPYTERNCSDLAKWIKTQELYPEFWDFRNASNIYYHNSAPNRIPWPKKLTSDISRFLHLDMVQAYENASKTTASARKEFGSDMNASTTVLASALKYNTPSEPLFVTYIKDQENTFYEEPIYNDDSKQLSYGIFLKDENGNIQVTTEGVGGCPSEYYNSAGFFIGGEEAVGNASYGLSKYKRHIGYDPHFTAYGNAAIGLYTPSASGVNEKEQMRQIGFLDMNELGQPNDLVGAVTDIIDRSEVINQTYLGSSNPKLTYDSVKDRFGFTEFYTPEYLGENGAAGVDEKTNPIAGDDGKALVYKINKRLRRQNFAPGMGPYYEKVKITVKNTALETQSTQIEVDPPNRNIYPFSIMDCHSGISINSFGITDENIWDKSLLGILGFTYDQLQSPVSASNTTQSRVNTVNIKKLNKVTTQAEIKAQDTLIYNKNIWGATMYKPNISTSLVLHDYKSADKRFYQWTDPIIVDTGSLTITAQGVPRKMLNPFFTIRSDLIDTAPYTGSADSGEKLPVMGHVNKSTDSGDFFVGGEDSVEFTITRQKPLSTITTAICDPDGSFSRVDDNSAIIYKVQRQTQLPVNLVASLFGNQ